MQNIQISLDSISTFLPLPLPLEDQKKICDIFRNIHSLEGFSQEEQNTLFSLYARLANLPVVTSDPSIIKAIVTFQTLFPSSHKTSAEGEIASGIESSDPLTAQAYHRIGSILEEIKNGRDPKTLTLNLKDLPLNNLPLCLFTDPRFADVNVMVYFKHLPSDLTIGSLRNIKLFEELTQASLLSLPSEVSDQIYLCLKPKDLARLSETPHTFSSILQQTTSKVDIRYPEQLTSFLQALDNSESWPTLTHLNIHCRHLTRCSYPELKDGDLKLIACKCPNLTSLVLYRCWAITDDGFAHLSSLTDLTDLHLFQSDLLTDNGFARLSSLTNLTTLILSGSQITDASLARLRSFAYLTAMNLSSCRNITYKGLQDLLPHLEKLKLLCLSSCHKITYEEGEALKRGFPEIGFDML